MTISRRTVLQSAAASAAWTCLARGGAAQATVDADGWITLFDGRTLDGWHVNPHKIGHGTGGHWHVEPDGVLAGEQDPPGSGNGGILLTDRQCGDFELALEMRPTWGVDSGVFLRATDAGQCLQMTVDYYNGGNIGHFYGEQTGGWVARSFSIEGDVQDGRLVKLRTIDAKTPQDAGLVAACTPGEWLDAWRIDDWNSAVIRVEGGRLPTITTSINGLRVGVFDAAAFAAPDYDREQVASLLGDAGSVAVQVHGGDSYPAGAKCRWRNIRLRTL